MLKPILVLLFLTIPLLAEDKPEAWQKGSVADVKLMKDHPTVITTEKAFAELYKKWKPDAKVPTVDFEKNLVLVATTVGSNIGGTPKLENGDLKFVTFGTADFGEGFRYLFVVFPKEGVKTLNGKELPK